MNRHLFSSFVLTLVSVLSLSLASRFFSISSCYQRGMQRQLLSINLCFFFFNNYCIFHWVKNVRIRNHSGPYFTLFGLNTDRYSIYLRIQSECGKMRTIVTWNTDIFYAVCTSMFCLCIHVNTQFPIKFHCFIPNTFFHLMLLPFFTIIYCILFTYLPRNIWRDFVTSSFVIILSQVRKVINQVNSFMTEAVII